MENSTIELIVKVIRKITGLQAVKAHSDFARKRMNTTAEDASNTGDSGKLAECSDANMRWKGFCPNIRPKNVELNVRTHFGDHS